MAKFKVAPTETVKHDGIVYMEGETIELTAKQAKALLESKTVLKVGKQDEEPEEEKAPKTPKKKAKKGAKAPKGEAAPPAGAVE
jgi:hypothetical protein